MSNHDIVQAALDEFSQTGVLPEERRVARAVVEQILGEERPPTD